MEKQKFQWPLYTMGVCYYPEHWDESLWESDLDRMKEAGISLVRIAEFSWNITEPEEGKFSFSFFDRFLALCEQKDMKVVFGTPSATPPAWLTCKYPEVLNCTEDGIPLRHGGRRHYNYNSPIYRQKVSRIVEELAKHYGPSPAICGWQIDNELNCETNSFYSEADKAAFRVFLREKYGTLDALNKAWGTAFWSQDYTDWSQISVPGRVLNRAFNPHQYLDYIRFISESAISFCRMQAEILRKYVKPGDFITTNGRFARIDNHRMERECLDVFMFDSYPNFAYGLDRADYFRRTPDPLAGDLNDRHWASYLAETRSICPHFGVMEQQAGAGGWATHMEAPMPKPGQLKLWALQSLLHGADMVSFFRWRTCTFGTEIYWHGILDYDNRDNRRLEEVRDFGRTMRKLAPLCGADFAAQVAIVKDYDNVWDEEADAWHRHIARTSEEAIFRQTQLSHVPCDYLYLTESTLPEDLNRYPVLIYPHPAILTAERAALLKNYVRQGGTLVVGCRAGFKQENGRCVMLPQPGLLQELTGTDVREYSFATPTDETETADWGGRRIPLPLFREVMETVGAEDENLRVLAKYTDQWYAGKAALVEKKTGKGRTLHLGGVFCRESLRMLFDYLGLAEPQKEFMDLPESVEYVERRKDGRTWRVLLNYLPTPQTVVLKKKMRDLCTDEELTGTAEVGPYGVRVLEEL